MNKMLGAGLSLVFSTVPGRLQRAGGSGAVVEIPRSGVVRVARALIESVISLPLQPLQSVQARQGGPAWRVAMREWAGAAHCEMAPAHVHVVRFVIRVGWQADVQTEGAIWTDREGPPRGG